MPALPELAKEAAVRSAMRAYLRASRSGRLLPEATRRLAEETAGVPLARMNHWEGVIRQELWEVAQSPRGFAWRFWVTPPVHASWLDLCSADGYARERSLRALAEPAPNGFFCLLALRRLNDWVPQVRAAARERLPSLAERTPSPVVVDALWHVLPHLSSWGRSAANDQQLIGDLCSTGDVARELKERLVGATAGPAKAVLANAGRTPCLDQYLEDIAAMAIQPSVRARAYRYLLDGHVYWVTGHEWRWTDVAWCKGRWHPLLGERPFAVVTPFATLLSRAAADGSPLVRRVAGDVLAERLEAAGTDARSIAARLAADEFPSVAERGRFALRRLTPGEESP